MMTSNRPLVLVIDDEPATAELIADVLRREGCEVVVRYDAHGGLEAARELPAPDLVLLDLELPDRSGRDVLREMKQDRSLSWIPVVVVSAAPDATRIYATDNIAKSDLLGGLARVIGRLRERGPTPIAA